MPLIQVADTRKALGQLANHVRRGFTRTKVLAIAGSNGKTTTKNLLHSVLSTKLKGTASPKSFNNDIGVPATLLPVKADDDYVIVEIGTNHPGEVEALSRMAEPDCAVIVSIGEEHLEFFKNLDGVRRENAQIVAGLRNGGPLIVTGDDPTLCEHLPRDRTTTLFGFGDNNAFRATDVHVDAEGTTFGFESRSWRVPLLGAHFAACGLAVIAVARWMGLSDADIQRGFDRAAPSEMRMQPKQIGSITLLNDAYNANPTSMRAALQTAQQIAPPRRLVLVLGQMGELGETSPTAHADVFAEARQMDALLITVGDAFKPHRSDRWFPDSTTATKEISTLLRPGDVVLLKGSRSTRLEKIAGAIEAAAFPSPGTPGEGRVRGNLSA